MTVSEKILNFYQQLNPPAGLPDDVVVMNPYKDATAWQLTNHFYQKFYGDNSKRTVLFGINPGRFGGGITGIPFTDPQHLQEPCGVANELDKRTELSSTFIYEMISAYGGVVTFYNHYYISAISPLGFMQDGKNLNYYDIPGWKKLFEAYTVRCIREQLDFIDQKVAYSIGKGQNLKFLDYLNDKYGFFKEIRNVPHPRWVMQYRLKRKQEFIELYLQELT